MFEPAAQKRVFGLPPGVDFPKALVAGILARMDGQAPEAMARITLLVNTRRMARRVIELFSQDGARLLPRVLTVGELAQLPGAAILGPTTGPLRRRLELARLISELIRSDPSLAPSEAAFDLADSLSTLIDEMHGEGVPAEAILNLDVSDQSGHWERTRRFIGIAEVYLGSVEQGLDAEAAQRRLVRAIVEAWQKAPPRNPILVAGSTGSRGSMAMLMEAVAALPQGAVVLPGFDYDAPTAMWGQLQDALTGEDHPQFRFVKLMRQFGLTPDDIERWTQDRPKATTRGALVSLALRPAPFTDAWLDEGPTLPDLAKATQDMSLIEAKSGRDEALSIALCLKSAADQGRTAALITPDRMLTRQVTAALDRWNIIPDDSAGLPLHLSPPGRFLRQVAELFSAPLRNETLIALLKHPLTHSGQDRGEHLRRTRDLELHIRRQGIHTPQQIDFESSRISAEADSDWVNWLRDCLFELAQDGKLSARDWLKLLCEQAGHISDGALPDDGVPIAGELWKEAAGRTAWDALEPIRQMGDEEYPLTAREFNKVLDHLLRNGVVRDRDAPDGNIMIWGTLEARVMGADLVILGGLNEGSWPESPAPDPWLNRVLRNQAGLLLPDRRIGLSAHDWQQAIGAPEVVLSRSLRSDDAETVPSRWLNRMTNLLSGLPDAGGVSALNAMRTRGALWLAQASRLDHAERVPPASRPSPRPPVTARPQRLSVTEVKRLIRDPYAIYAKHVLRLRPLNPLVTEPDALLRGTVIHGVLEGFIGSDAPLDRQSFLEMARARLDAGVPWPLARRLWFGRLELIADWFLEQERLRRQISKPAALEARLTASSQMPLITLTGVADRIDRAADGTYRLLDYKTGKPPGPKEQAHFDKQLLLETALLTLIGADSGSTKLSPGPVSDARFIGLGRIPSEVEAPIVEHGPEEVWAEFLKLITAYSAPEQGYTARRAMQKEDEASDYDQLARFGEWDLSADPVGEDVT